MNSRIIILSDTHWSTSDHIPNFLREEILKADALIHCGDFVSIEILSAFSSHSSLFAVCGNCDEAHVRRALPKERLFNLSGINIGLIHGERKNFSYIYELKAKFQGADLIIFGHSHIPTLERIESTIFFNPGSLTYPRGGNPPSFGIMEIKDGNFEIEHIFI